MTFDEYWTKLQEKKPIPENGSVHLTKAQFCAILKQSYEIGQNHIVEADKPYDFLRDFFDLKGNKE